MLGTGQAKGSVGIIYSGGKLHTEKHTSNDFAGRCLKFNFADRVSLRSERIEAMISKSEPESSDLVLDTQQIYTICNSSISHTRHWPFTMPHCLNQGTHTLLSSRRIWARIQPPALGVVRYKST